ncbi:MAG TPA: hypothetical protein VKS20_15170 [Candidatus Acidoferrales bacterium]|nr:hypothetical protein [Candidatus Acidoferrales bacterium]
MAVNSTKLPVTGAQARSTSSRRASAQHSKHPSDDEILGLVTSVARPAGDASFDSNATTSANAAANASSATAAQSDSSAPAVATADSAGAAQAANTQTISPELAQALDANPQLREAVDAAQQFRAVFPTPAAAQDAKNQLDELDGMFFSAQPADHAALAARIHELSPGAFHGLAQAMQAHAATIAAAHAAPPQSASAPSASSAVSSATPAPCSSGPDCAASAQSDLRSLPSDSQNASRQPDANRPAGRELQDDAGGSPVAAPFRPAASDTPAAAPAANPPASAGDHSAASQAQSGGPSSEFPASSAQPPAARTAQLAFFHSTNAAAVQQIVSAIESQVNQLLPQSVSAGTKTRIVGEIYRDLDSALRANRQLSEQLRGAFHFAAADVANQGGNQQASLQARQQAIVALVAGRAKQALPSIAKRVIGEWTHSVVSANRDRLTRHDSAAKRVDISGSGPSDGVNRKPISPREVNYKRLSDADILNL